MFLLVRDNSDGIWKLKKCSKICWQTCKHQIYGEDTKGSGLPITKKMNCNNTRSNLLRAQLFPSPHPVNSGVAPVFITRHNKGQILYGRWDSCARSPSPTSIICHFLTASSRTALYPSITKSNEYSTFVRQNRDAEEVEHEKWIADDPRSWNSYRTETGGGGGKSGTFCREWWM